MKMKAGSLILKAGLELHREANQQEWEPNCVYSGPRAAGVVSFVVSDWHSWRVSSVTAALFQGNAAAGSVTRPRASTAAPAQRSKPTPTFASVPSGLKVDTVKRVRKKQVDGSFCLRVNSCGCNFSWDVPLTKPQTFSWDPRCFVGRDGGSFSLPGWSVSECQSFERTQDTYVHFKMLGMSRLLLAFK